MKYNDLHIFFSSLVADEIVFLFQEVDPCEDLTDDDIRTAIQNATGPRSALFVPEVGLTLFLFSSLNPNFIICTCF